MNGRAPSEFERFTDSYTETVNDAIGFSGRDQEFFLEAKVEILEAVAAGGRTALHEQRVLDVGCGVGLMERGLRRRGIRPVGIDVAGAPLLLARRSASAARYARYDGRSFPFVDAAFDLAFASCVLHHVLPGDRPGLLAEMARVVRPGGLVVIFEHNAFNPLTRLAVARCEFDRDAILLGLGEVRRLLSGADLPPQRAGYFLLTPWRGAFFRAVERRLGRLPLGAQYFAVGAKPVARTGG